MARDVQVKICGVRDTAAARVASEVGADAIGFIRAPARRQVSASHIREILDELRVEGAVLPLAVSVHVNVTVYELAADIEASGVDIVQLAGDEEPDMLDALRFPAIKALRFADGTSVDTALREAARWLERPNPARWVLVEGSLPGTHGGTGTQADWSLAAAVAERYPVWLAGGLAPENVRRAIGQVRPAGVDVSSGVECDGAKDAALIRDFVANAHEAGALSCPDVSR